MNARPLIDSLRDRILAACDPERIILFGSHAKGTATVASDIDLLVVGDFSGANSLHVRDLCQALYPSVIAIDLHIISSQDLAAGTVGRHGFMASVLSTGITLYERRIS